MTQLGAAFIAAMESDDDSDPDTVAYIEDDLEPCFVIVTMDGRPGPVAVYEVEVSPVEVELPGEVCHPCPAMEWLLWLAICGCVLCGIVGAAI